MPIRPAHLWPWQVRDAISVSLQQWELGFWLFCETEPPANRPDGCPTLRLRPSPSIGLVESYSLRLRLVQNIHRGGQLF